MPETKMNRFFKDRINRRNRKKLKNMDFSLIASNCNGGIISHDLGLKFRSPFINLWIRPKDYIKLLKNLKEYMSCDLQFIKENGIEHPVAMLNDIKIYFAHYKTDDEAREKWIERSKRLNYDKLFIIFTDRDGCSLEDMKVFDELPYENKIIFVNKKHPEIKSAYYIKGFEKEKSVGRMEKFISKYSGKRYLDYFDYVKWFNNKK